MCSKKEHHLSAKNGQDYYPAPGRRLDRAVLIDLIKGELPPA